MNTKIEKILSIPPAPIPVTEERYADPVGGWSSRISFLHGKESFPHLAPVKEALDPKQEFKNELSNANRKVSKNTRMDVAEGVRNSSIGRPDLRTETHFPAISPVPYVTHYRMVHNGNGPGTVTSSLNRITPKVSMARQMTTTDPNGTERPICYAGRPDSWNKCVELAGLIFQGQLRCGKVIPQNDGVYQLKFTINSSLCTFPGLPETKLTKREHDILKQFNGQTISLKRPDGTLCHVKCEVIFFAKQFNFSTSLEKTLHASKSGKEVSETLSANTDEIRQFLGDEKIGRAHV